MQADFEFHINGLPHRAAGGGVAVRLLDYLREQMLTAAKDACSSGGCGMCSVLIEGEDAGGEAAFSAVNACMLTLPMVAGRRIWTAEALAGGRGGAPHAVAVALARKASGGCGYCLPGVAVALCARDAAGGELSAGDARAAVGGVLCRCTGYSPFVDALVAARGAVAGGALGGTPGRRTVEVQPITYRDAAGGTFYRPATVAEALRLALAHPGAKIVAGGTARSSFAPAGASAATVISLEAVAEMGVIERSEGEWSIGAGVSVASLSARLGVEFPMLGEMEARFGSVQVRNRATVGGNLAAAAHHSDLAPVLLALGARVRIEGPDGIRELPLDQFFVGYRQTVLSEGELLVEVVVPRAPEGANPAVRRLGAFYKVSKRRHLDRAIANAAFTVVVDGGGHVAAARLAFGGVAAYPVRAYEAEDLLVGAAWEGKAAQAVAAKLKESFPASTDAQATAAYRNALASGLWQRFYAAHRDPGKPSPADGAVRQMLSRPLAG